MAQKIDGKAAAARVKEELALQVCKLRELGVTPGLAVIMVGDNPASAVYVRNKEKAAQQVGIQSKMIHLPEQTTQAQLLALIEELNRDAGIHGILVQLPLPDHFDERAVLLAISPNKDVDAFHPRMWGIS